MIDLKPGDRFTIAPPFYLPGKSRSHSRKLIRQSPQKYRKVWVVTKVFSGHASAPKDL